ncbi:MAG TPA: DUF3168 domain-containing protein [Rhizobiaceae bacterium]|nr:DUF3168 domain-containing protein [Rhizobiaceae bacterium]
MIDASLVVQGFFRERLVGSPAVTSLVSAGSIFDRNGPPEVFPCIVIGEAQIVASNTYQSPASYVYSTLHLWAKEESTVYVKRIGAAVRAALWHAGGSFQGRHIGGTVFEDARYLRDPSGEHSHGVIVFKSYVGGF